VTGRESSNERTPTQISAVGASGAGRTDPASRRHGASARTLDGGRPAGGVDASLWLATLLSIAAAALVMALVGYQGAWDVDPLGDLFRPFVALIR
jgi:hypothetical protein